MTRLAGLPRALALRAGGLVLRGRTLARRAGAKMVPGCLPWLLREHVSHDGLSVPAHDVGLELGAAVSFERLRDAGYRRFVASNFSVVTPENDMKPFVLVDWGESRRQGRLCLDFSRADLVVAWARENGLRVRGHVIASHLDTPEWFFREGFRSDGPLLGRDEACARMEQYTHQVIGHFERRFPGVISCWDVVNEPLGNSPDEYDADDPRHLRTNRRGVPNAFLVAMGPDYVERCFLYARDAVDEAGADIRLYLNEFNTMRGKKPLIIRLAQDVNAYACDSAGSPRRLVDGIGMEGYLGAIGDQSRCLREDQIGRMHQAIDDYAQAGFEVQVTELTVRNYDEGANEDHAAYLGRLFDGLALRGKGCGGGLEGVTIWGLVDQPRTREFDDTAWNEHGGLVDSRLRPKAAWEAVRAALERGKVLR